MLIEFSVSNFRSFHSKQTLSLLPKEKKRKIHPLKVEGYPKLMVLPSCAIYGPNNAGKSNFLKAIKALDWLVTKSGNFNSDKPLLANEFFKLNTQSIDKPTFFEIDFIAPNQKRYLYIVEFDRKKIYREELYFYNITPTGKNTLKTLYKRDKQDISFTALKGVKESVSFSENQLFLSRGDIDGNEELKAVYSFFGKKLEVFQLTETEYTNFLTRGFAKTIIDSEGKRVAEFISTLLKEFNTGILEISSQVNDLSKIVVSEEIPQSLKDKILEDLKYDLKTTHKLFDGERESGITEMSMNDQSTGVRKLVGLLPFILSTLKKGNIIAIDEMNTSIHPEITSLLIELFNNPFTNPKKAQLIITTHDITLLNRELYDKDGIYVIEKDNYGASDLYSFSEITGLRNNIKLSDYYESGRLGGVANIAMPYLESIINKYVENGEAE